MTLEHEARFGIPSSVREFSSVDAVPGKPAALADSAILVVESDPGVVQTVVRFLAGTRRCITAASVREARHHFATFAGSFCGFIFAAALPDGFGVGLLRAAHDMAPTAPALILANAFDAATTNRAYALGGSCILKPIGSDPLRRFVADAMASEFVSHEGLRRRVTMFAQRHDLTPAATEILMAKVAGYTREEILDLRGVRPNTYKTHVRQILKRTGMTSLEHVRRAVIVPTVPVVPLRKAV
jgi:DNA-binding NarL/FixJ family response regulator